MLVGLATLPACASIEQRTEPTFHPAPQALQAPAPTVAGKVTTTRTVVVHFTNNSDEIRAGAMQTLYGTATELRGSRLTSVRITGYTDAAGKRGHNQKLSQRRAEAVASQLRKLGIATEAMTVSGAGETKGGARHRAEDRRVEIVIEQVQETTAAVSTGTVTAFHTALTAASTDAPAAAVSAFPALLPQSVPHAAAPLQSRDKQAIKRDFALDGTTWLPPPAA